MKFLICLLLFSVSFSAQETLNGRIIDKDTHLPVLFVSIGIIGKTVGTLSNDKGEFELAVLANQQGDSLKISAIGYKSQVFLVRQLVKEPGKIFLLESAPTQLAEVTVSSKKAKYKILGTTHYSKNNCTGFADIEGNWKGSEAAILVENNKHITLRAFSFYIIQNKYKDSLLFRLNFYKAVSSTQNSNIKVGATILQKAIVFKVGVKQGEFTLPIDTYNITTSADFFISLECLMDKMEISDFCYSGSYGVKSYFKIKAFSAWNSTRGGGADFNVKVSYNDK